MLRIIKLESRGQHGGLKLEGKLIGAWVAELRSICDQRSDATPYAIDVADLSYADSDGVRLLQQLMSAGIQISGPSQFIHELLRMDVPR